MQVFLADPLVALAADEAKEKRDPAQFLLDHLEGQRSVMPGGDANTYAVYRSVIVRALAQWLESDKLEAKATQEELRQKLARI